MADLMAQNKTSLRSLYRGEEVEGKVLLVGENDLVLDLGTKVEGVLGKRDLDEEVLVSLKVGDTLKAFVAVPENESGQAILTLHKQLTQLGRQSSAQTQKWQKVITAYQRGTQISGRIVEMNKGGLVVEVDHLRAFLPSSQLNLAVLHNISDHNQLTDQEIHVSVLEIDPGNNRLIVTTRKKLSGEQKAALSQVKEGETVKATVAAVLPFGLFVEFGGVEGMIFPQELSWSPSAKIVEDEQGASVKKEEDLNKQFVVGQELEAKVLSIDEPLGRANLSLRQLQQDPFSEIAQKYQADDVVSGVVTEVNQNGVVVQLKDNVAGFLPAAGVESGVSYQVGQTANFLVDNVDQHKRRINLAPFITSTVGLIYK